MIKLSSLSTQTIELLTKYTFTDTPIEQLTQDSTIKELLIISAQNHDISEKLAVEYIGGVHVDAKTGHDGYYPKTMEPIEIKSGLSISFDRVALTNLKKIKELVSIDKLCKDENGKAILLFKIKATKLFFDRYEEVARSKTNNFTWSPSSYINDIIEVRYITKNIDSFNKLPSKLRKHPLILQAFALGLTSTDKEFNKLFGPSKRPKIRVSRVTKNTKNLRTPKITNVRNVIEVGSARYLIKDKKTKAKVMSLLKVSRQSLIEFLYMSFKTNSNKDITDNIKKYCTTLTTFVSVSQFVHSPNGKGGYRSYNISKSVGFGQQPSKDTLSEF